MRDKNPSAFGIVDWDYVGLLYKRRKIIDTLYPDQEKRNIEITKETGLTKSNVSRYLNQLYWASIMKKRQQGNVVTYRLTENGRENYVKLLSIRRKTDE